MTDLPPHDIGRRCTKCDTLTPATVEYRAHPPRLTWTGDSFDEIATHGAGAGAECLLRRCRDCGWAWLETCADATPASNPQTYYDRISAMPCDGTQGTGRDATP